MATSDANMHADCSLALALHTCTELLLTAESENRTCDKERAVEQAKKQRNKWRARIEHTIIYMRRIVAPLALLHRRVVAITASLCRLNPSVLSSILSCAGGDLEEDIAGDEGCLCAIRTVPRQRSLPVPEQRFAHANIFQGTHGPVGTTERR